MTKAVEFLDPWYGVDDAETRAGLEHQLQIEVSERHILFGKSARLIARRCDTDDALFELPDGKVAEVHMTWRRSVEPDPRWPVTAIFASIEEWVRESMLPLAEELSEPTKRHGG